mmetsp:Transcript_43746/g.107396  ORF Transcript_43746/g.107396 Transcript_43746/m.107396 type:complete len:130 (+) Transcript_43746:190-579(+)
MAITREQMEAIAQSVQETQGELNVAQNNRGSLRAQLTEVEFVAKELKMLTSEDDGRVFKLVGPIMVAQGLDEARANVNTRLEFIGAELKKADDLVEKLEKKSEQTRMALLQGQQLLMDQMRAQGAAQGK